MANAERRFKKGDEVVMLIHGAGVTSEESHVVASVRNGVVKLEDTDDYVFSAATGRRINADPSPFGFSFEIRRQRG